MVLTKGKILKYALLPGILPRLKALLTSGFSHLACLVAVIYGNVGLLPAGHPYLRPSSFGRFGLRHVIAEASNNLVMTRENLDKSIIFFTILIGLALLFLQFFLLFFSFFIYPALAGPIESMFLITPLGPQQDIAFVVLDRVFGVMNFMGSDSFFGSCVASFAPACTDIRGDLIISFGIFPSSFHLALHQMMMFYSFGIAYLSGVVILYFVVAIVGETIASGTPFGQRFSKAWYVPRLIMFFALITPMSTSGLNAGISASQFIALGAAKWGSNFATNAWADFNDTVFAATNYTLLGDKETLIAEPNVPEIGALTQFLYVARLCMYLEDLLYDVEVLPYLVRPSHPTYNPVTSDDYMDFLASASGGDAFLQAFQFSRYGKVTLRFGHRNPPGGTAGDPNDPPDSYEDEWGYVKPICGEITFDTAGMVDPGIDGADPVITGIGAGGLGIQENYYLSIYEYLLTDDFYDDTTYCIVQAVIPEYNNPDCVNTNYTLTSIYPTGSPSVASASSTWPHRTLGLERLIYYDNLNKHYLTGWYYDGASYAHHNTNSVIDQLRLNYDYSMPTEILERGWAGAALWYNKVAEINGVVAAAVQNLPIITKYPMVMEQVAEQHKINDVNPSWVDRFNPLLQDGRQADLPRKRDHEEVAALYAGYRFWALDDIQTSPYTTKSGNSIIDVVNMILGTNGLYDILENRGVHPLAMLSALGKGMMDASIRNLFAGVVGQGIGEIFSDNFFGDFAEVASGFAFQFGMIGLSLGFVLYYVVPILPFLYFFFAFGGWIKSVFEAVVAMPLWALAHIKIDGEGLPGPWATNGYFLLLEIFLRPILIIFGFLASITLYQALVDALSDLYNLIIMNAFGFDIEADLYTTVPVTPTQNSTDFWRSPIDEFFFTALYTIIVYMLGLCCFKLVDQIPNNIMRWMGVTVSAFQEQSQDPAGQLTGQLFNSTQVAGAQLTSMVGRMKGISSGLTAEDAYMASQMGS